MIPLFRIPPLPLSKRVLFLLGCSPSKKALGRGTKKISSLQTFRFPGLSRFLKFLRTSQILYILHYLVCYFGKIVFGGVCDSFCRYCRYLVLKATLRKRRVHKLHMRINKTFYSLKETTEININNPGLTLSFFCIVFSIITELF